MLLPVASAKDYLPPNTAFAEGSAYWQNLLLNADRWVKQFCGRELEPADYVERGDIVDVAVEIPGTIGLYSARRYVYYTAEHIRSVTTVVAGGATLAATDYEVVGDALVLGRAGDIKVTYAGGYATDSDDMRVLRGAVAAAVEVMHEVRQLGGMASRSGAGEAISADADPYRHVKAMLAPYIRYHFGDAPPVKRAQA
jgi:cobalamin biosynthesis protein CbiD